VQTFYIANATYPISTACVKMSLLFQYLRLFPENSVKRLLTILTLAVTALWGFVFAFMAWFPCFPVSAFWDISISGKCYGYGSPNPDEFNAVYTGHSASNMVLDMVVLALPIPLYFSSGTQQRTRAGLLALLFMGGLVTVFSIWRLATLVEHKSATYPTFDPTWYAPISIALGAMEVDLASMCGCVPVFWPVLTQTLGRIMVTQEVKITREPRDGAGSDEDQYEMSLGPDLETADSKGSSNHRVGIIQHSRNGSEAELKQIYDSSDMQTTPPKSTNATQKKKKKMAPPIAASNSHYRDRFVVASVDPLGNAFSRGQADIRAQTSVEGPVSKKSGL
jgi:hypothetical protein